MKKGIHPEYKPVTITCVCGEVIHTRSTKSGNLRIEICSKCHPYFTGKQKFVDTAGRVERFRKRFANLPATTAQSRQAGKGHAGTPQGSPEAV